MRILVLDIGGVFYRGWPAEDFWPDWAARTGLSREAMEGFLSGAPEAREARLGRIPAATYYALAGARLGADPGALQALAEAAYLSDFNQPLADWVGAIRRRGVSVSALTNSLSTEAQLKARPALVGLFDHVITSCEAGCAKPDREIFRALLTRLSAEPAEVVFADDDVRHVEAARALGLSAVHFQASEQAIAEIEGVLALD